MKEIILYTRKEAAKILGYKPQTLAYLNMIGKGPKPVYVGARSVRYRHEDLEAYIANGGDRKAA